ncbi:MAG: nitrite/sulfite reductase, partial [Cyanobacteria bacterium P01_E01_bin.48]
WDKNAAEYGRSVAVVPSKRVPDVVEFLVDMYMQEREGKEKFNEFVNRIGKKAIRDRVQPFLSVPNYVEDKSFYTDWADNREYTLGDIGIGECAGEVVTLTDFGVAAAESIHFDATILLEETPSNGDAKAALDKAFESMLSAAQALLKIQNIDIASDASSIVGEFRKYFYDTQLFFDPFAKGKFASYLFKAYDSLDEPATIDRAKQLIEEARLFIEAAHACNARMVEDGITTPAGFQRWLNAKQLQTSSS